MLSSVQSFADKIKAIPPTITPIVGIQEFTQVLADFMDQVQANPGGSVGIFTLNQAVMIPLFLAMPPVPDNSWIEPFADIWTAGVTASVITPATVTNAAWIGSGFLDTQTLPIAAATITTIPVAKAQLVADLHNIMASSNSPVPLAQAINDATLKFIFLCIGLGPPPTFVPIPIPLGAE